MLGLNYYNTGTSMIIITGSVIIYRSDSSDKIGDILEEVGYFMRLLIKKITIQINL